MIIDHFRVLPLESESGWSCDACMFFNLSPALICALCAAPSTHPPTPTPRALPLSLPPPAVGTNARDRTPGMGIGISQDDDEFPEMEEGSKAAEGRDRGRGRGEEDAGGLHPPRDTTHAHALTELDRMSVEEEDEVFQVRGRVFFFFCRKENEGLWEVSALDGR